APTPRDQRRDRIEKVDEYAAFGVRYYWIVDSHARTLEILELRSDRRYAHALGATDGMVTSAPGCDGLVIDPSGAVGGDRSPGARRGGRCGLARAALRRVTS